jgi:hypothetical protein
MRHLEKYFENFRKNIIGIDQTFQSPYGEQKIIYGDWIASGRLYKPNRRIKLPILSGRLWATPTPKPAKPECG